MAHNKHGHGSLGPTGDRLRKLFIQLAANAGLHNAHFRQAQLGQVQENQQQTYAPLAAADQQHGTILYNPQSPNAAPPNSQPIGRAQALRYQNAVVAHETGHLAEPGLIGGRANADRYQQASLGYLGRPYLTNSVAGRAENRTTAQPRDQWGLPTEGPYDMHSAPNEQYANDAGAALGYRFAAPFRGEPGATRGNGVMYSQTAAPPAKLRRLQRMGLVPKRRGKSS